MSRINTNIPSIIAVQNLNNNNTALQTSLERLSTGYRINSGKDDPAGLIASENLRAEQTATSTAIGNAQRADNIIGTAEGALGEVSNLLVSLQGLVGNAANSAGLSQDEKDANQLQVDSILSTINRISNSASFEGVKLLNVCVRLFHVRPRYDLGVYELLDQQAPRWAALPLTAVTVSVISSGAPPASSISSVPAPVSTGAATISRRGQQGNRAIVVCQFHQELRDYREHQSIHGSPSGVAATLSSDTKSVRQAAQQHQLRFVAVRQCTVQQHHGVHHAERDDVADQQQHGYGNAGPLTVNGTTATSDGLNVKAVFGDLLDVVIFTLNAWSQRCGNEQDLWHHRRRRHFQRSGCPGQQRQSRV